MKKVKKFVEIAKGCAGKIEISSGRSTVDGKSIMGIFTLELKNNLSMKIEDGKDSPSLIQAFEPFIVS